MPSQTHVDRGIPASGFPSKLVSALGFRSDAVTNLHDIFLENPKVFARARFW